MLTRRGGGAYGIVEKSICKLSYQFSGTLHCNDKGQFGAVLLFSSRLSSGSVTNPRDLPAS
jgi:hypothetical protein